MANKTGKISAEQGVRRAKGMYVIGFVAKRSGQKDPWYYSDTRKGRKFDTNDL